MRSMSQGLGFFQGLGRRFLGFRATFFFSLNALCGLCVSTGDVFKMLLRKPSLGNTPPLAPPASCWPPPHSHTSQPRLRSHLPRLECRGHFKRERESARARERERERERVDGVPAPHPLYGFPSPSLPQGVLLRSHFSRSLLCL